MNAIDLLQPSRQQVNTIRTTALHKTHKYGCDSTKMKIDSRLFISLLYPYYIAPFSVEII